MLELAQMLRRRLGALARKVPTGQMPDWILRIAGVFNPTVRQFVPELGKIKSASNAKARRVLGWEPRGVEEAVIASAESLVRLGALGLPAAGRSGQH
jgi:nucleoside-diphosphate-sugar epimerase